MRKFISKIIIAIVAFTGAASLSSCNYNSLVEQQQGVDQAWAQVENQYQRRADLIPNLVNTVKGYSTHESETLEKVTLARAKSNIYNNRRRQPHRRKPRKIPGGTGGAVASIEVAVGCDRGLS